MDTWKLKTRTAKKIERRIWLYRLYIQKITKGRKNPYPSHIIEAIDPKDDFWNWSKQKQTETLRKIRKCVGIFGGAEINHLWAFDKSNFKEFYRPHKHLICFGWLKSNHTQIIKDEFGINLTTSHFNFNENQEQKNDYKKYTFIVVDDELFRRSAIK